VQDLRAGDQQRGTVARLVLGMAAGPQVAQPAFPELTSREREVLDLIGAGQRNAEIARRTSLAPKTVANHISAIFAKLQVADRGEAIILARAAGLGRDTGLGRGCGSGAPDGGAPNRYRLRSANDGS
jgi:DNA-binding NarL/FixJ family response regulator